MASLAALSLLLGCSDRTEICENDKITYVGVACSHMCFDECYGISVNVENGKALLSGECFVDGELIQIDEAEISDADLNALNKLCNTLDPSLLKKEKARKVNVFVADETTYNFRVEWENEKSVERSFIPEKTGNEIKNRLFSLAEKYK